MDVLSYALAKKAGGGGGGTTDYSQLTNKPSINNVTLSGNKSSEDLGLASKTYVDNLVSASLKREVVNVLPVSDIKTNTIYMVPKATAGTQNVYDEYMYINSAWEIIGNTEVDLTGYATEDYVDDIVGDISTILDTFVTVDEEEY